MNYLTFNFHRTDYIAKTFSLRKPDKGSTPAGRKQLRRKKMTYIIISPHNFVEVFLLIIII